MPRCAAGFTYLLILFTVALAGMGLVSVAQFWHTACLRDKEQDLIFAGNQFRAAIGRYYERNAGAADQFPKTLEALLGDPHAPVTLRYLRRIYPDPFTGKAEWGLIKTPSGSIMGVYSLAPGIPVKQAQFAPQDAQFAGAQAYSDWKFVYAGSATAQVPGMSPSLPPAAASPAPTDTPRAAPAAAPQTMLPQPTKRERTCEEIAQRDALVCADQARRFGANGDCLDSATARVRACEAGSGLPPLNIRFR